MKRYFSILALALAVTACQLENNPVGTGLSSVSFTAESFVMDLQTRTAVGPGGEFVWSEGDRLGVFPDDGDQVSFSLKSGAGTGSAVFDGGGWALKPGISYDSYFPFIADYSLAKNNIPVTYEGQTCSGAGSTELGKYDYMYAHGVGDGKGKLNFKYKHLNSMLVCQPDLPAGTYSKMTVSVDDKIFVKSGYFNLSAQAPEIVGTEYTDNISVALDNFTLEQAATVSVCVMIAPVDLTDAVIKLTFVSENGSYQFESSVGKVCVAGHGYLLSTAPVGGNAFMISHTCLEYMAPAANGAQNIDWGDGTEASYDPELSHTYARQGQYDVVVSGPDITSFSLPDICGVSLIDFSNM